MVLTRYVYLMSYVIVMSYVPSVYIVLFLCSFSLRRYITGLMLHTDYNQPTRHFIWRILVRSKDGITVVPEPHLFQLFQVLCVYEPFVITQLRDYKFQNDITLFCDLKDSTRCRLNQYNAVTGWDFGASVLSPSMVKRIRVHR